MRKKFRLLPRSLHQKRQFPLARSLRLTTSIRHVHNAISFSFSYLSTRTWVSIRHLVSSGTFTEYKEENFFFPPPQRKWKAKQFSCAYYLFFHSLGPSFFFFFCSRVFFVKRGHFYTDGGNRFAPSKQPWSCCFIAAVLLYFSHFERPNTSYPSHIVLSEHSLVNILLHQPTTEVPSCIYFFPFLKHIIKGLMQKLLRRH